MTAVEVLGQGTLLWIWKAIVPHTVTAVRSNFTYFDICNLYVFGQLVRLALEVVQVDWDFMEVILVYTLCLCSILCCWSQIVPCMYF